MALSDVIKKGAGAPLAGDLIVGGIGIDSANGKLYVKKDDLTITSPGGTATETTNTPAGNIVATNVQLAINELDAEKASVGHTHTGAYEPADATILKSADIGVNVQAYTTALSNVSGTNTGDQIASSVANTPAGNISSTNVQAAINELDSEKAPLASPALTGNPTTVTVETSDNDTTIASTSFVRNAIAVYAPGNGLGVGQAWQDVVASRALDTTYTNSTGRSIDVLISMGLGDNQTGNFTIDSMVISIINSAGTVGTQAVPVSFTVPDGSTYSANAGSSLQSWMELR